MDFINSNFFRVKGHDDENYNIILTIFLILVPYPITSAMLLIALTDHYIHPLIYHIIVCYATQGIQRKSRTSPPESPYYSLQSSHYSLQSSVSEGGDDDGVTTDDGTNNESDAEVQQIKRLNLRSLLFTNWTITIALFIIHVISNVKYIRYGNEVLHDQPVGNLNISHQAIPIIHTVISLLTMIISLFFVIVRYAYSYIKEYNMYHQREGYEQIQPGDETEGPGLPPSKLNKTVAVSVAFNIIYLGSYFSPFMALAFIHDPLRTCFLYLLVMVGVICVYLVWFGIILTCLIMTRCRNSKVCCYIKCIYCTESCTTVISTGYIAVIIVYLFVVGSFESLDPLKKLTLPLIIFFLTYLFLKPIVDYIKSLYIKKDESKDANDPEKGLT